MARHKVLVPDWGEMTGRPSFCHSCPIAHVTRGYVPLHSTVQSGSTLLVGEAAGEDEGTKGRPFIGKAGAWLTGMMDRAGVPRDSVHMINCIGCQPPDNIFPLDKKWRATPRKAAWEAVQHCAKNHLWPAINKLQPSKVFACGDHALAALTTRKGIMIWRGSPLPLRGTTDKCRVMPLLHPSYLARDAKFVSVEISDLRKQLDPPPEHYTLYASLDDLSAFRAPVFAFDFEWDYNSDIILVGLTSKFYEALVTAPSPQAQHELKRIFEQATDLIGHNIIGADTRYFERLDWQVSARLHDTMLKQHLVQPDFRHSLAFVSSVFLNKPFWKGRGSGEEDEFGNKTDTKVQWRTWDQTDAIPVALGGYGGCKSADEAYRLYNARDNDASFQINQHLDYLLRKWNLERVYWNVSVPMAHIVREIGDRGIRIDPAQVKELRGDLITKIEQLETTLPEGLAPQLKAITKMVQAPPDTYKPKSKKCKGLKRLGTQHDPIEITFHRPDTSLECPSCSHPIQAPKLAAVKRIRVPGTKLIRPWASPAQLNKYATSQGLKLRIDRKRGTVSADALTRKGWGREHTEFRIVDQLKKYNTLKNNFAKEALQTLDRMYFNLLVHGTNEGRLSSTGRREGIDLNIQNQPHDFRKIYIPDQPDYSLIELDYSGGENWLTAILAQDHQRLERLRQPGYNEHLDLARQLFSRELPSTATKKQAQDWNGKDLYDVAKHVNHGGNYGMTHIKQKEYCDGEGLFFTELQHKEFIKVREAMNPGTTLWQQETIARARRDGYLRNPFGRVRWFSTHDVATKSLAFLPASTLADIMLRAMIAHYPHLYYKELVELGVGVMGVCEQDWFINIQVHDSLVLQGPSDQAYNQLARSASIMRQPWAELNGFALDIGMTHGEPGASWADLDTITQERLDSELSNRI